MTALALLGLSGACVEQQATLTIVDGSQVMLQAPVVNGQPALPALATKLVGSIDTTITLDVNLASLLLGRPLHGTLSTDRLLIAGTSVAIVPGLESGTICTSLNADDPGDGTIEIRLLRGHANINTSVNSLIQVTNPALVPLLGGPVPFPVMIDVEVPVNIGDLVGALAGDPLPISLEQEVMADIPKNVPLLGGGKITGKLVVEAAAEAPQSPLLRECNRFLAQQRMMQRGMAAAPAAPRMAPGMAPLAPRMTAPGMAPLGLGAPAVPAPAPQPQRTAQR